jgi:hypothetical protein
MVKPDKYKVDVSFERAFETYVCIERLAALGFCSAFKEILRDLFPTTVVSDLSTSSNSSLKTMSELRINLRSSHDVFNSLRQSLQIT